MKKRYENRSSANFLYDYFTVPEKLHEYHNGYYLSEGINEIALYENCYFVLDLICNHKLNFEIEIWHFARYTQDLFFLTGKNKNDIIFVEIKNLQSDFYFDDLIILKKGKLLCLPIEENIYSL